MKSPLHFLKILDADNLPNHSVIKKLIDLLIFLSIGTIIAAFTAAYFEIKVDNERKNIIKLTTKLEFFINNYSDFLILRNHHDRYFRRINSIGEVFNELEERGNIQGVNNEKFLMNYNHHLLAWKDLENLNRINIHFSDSLIFSEYELIDFEKLSVNMDKKKFWNTLEKSYMSNFKKVQPKGLIEFIKSMNHDDISNDIKKLNYFMYNPQMIDEFHFNKTSNLKRMENCNEYILKIEAYCVINSEKIKAVVIKFNDISTLIKTNTELLLDYLRKNYLEAEEQLKVSKQNLVIFNSYASNIFLFTFVTQILIFVIIQISEVYSENRRGWRK